MPADLARLTDWAVAVVLLVAAGYVIAYRRRSRRAAGLALLGLTVVGLWLVQLAVGDLHDRLARATGGNDRATVMTVTVWSRSAHLATAYALLIWAVVADRPPPADDDAGGLVPDD